MKDFEFNGLTSTIAALLFAGITGIVIFFGIVKSMYAEGAEGKKDINVDV